MDAKNVALPLFDVKGWIKLLSILQIIGGAMYCMSIIGAVVGWVPIVIGLKGLKAASRIEDGINCDDPYALTEGTENLASAIKWVGALSLIGLCISILMGVLYVFLIGAVIASQSNY